MILGRFKLMAAAIALMLPSINLIQASYAAIARSFPDATFS